jgi:hypothetical protein
MTQASTLPNFTQKHWPLLAHLGQHSPDFNLALFLDQLSRSEFEQALDILRYVHRQGAKDSWLQQQAQDAHQQQQRADAYQQGNQAAQAENPYKLLKAPHELAKSSNPYDFDQAAKQHMAWHDGFMAWVETQVSESW